MSIYLFQNYHISSPCFFLIFPGFIKMRYCKSKRHIAKMIKQQSKMKLKILPFFTESGLVITYLDKLNVKFKIINITRLQLKDTVNQPKISPTMITA